MKHHRPLTVIALVAAIGLSACASDSAETTPDSLTIVAYDSFTVDPTSFDAFTKETGKKVGINVVGMGTIVEEMTKKTPPPDVIVLPFQLMTTLSLDGGVVPGTFSPLGRTRMGLAVRAGAPHPDISTVEKFAAALKSAAGLTDQAVAVGR